MSDKVTIAVHELTGLSKKLNKLNDKALKALEDGLSDADPKIRLESAKTLLKMNVDVSRVISDESISRIMIALKHGEAIKELPMEKAPLVDFSNIQEV